MSSEAVKSLLVKLNYVGLSRSNQPLFDFLRDLITAAQQIDSAVTFVAGTVAPLVAGGITQLTGDVTAIGPGVAVATVPALASEVLSASDITAFFPNSRELLAGTNVTFDDTVPNEKTINVAAVSGADYVVMSSGSEPGVPLTDGSGNFIYVTYTP